MKFDKCTYPSNTNPEDFAVFGPPATDDGEFEKCKIADLGCFDQSGKDSNKYYHAAIVQNRVTKKWYVYFEWGRTGSTSPQFQFVDCNSEAEAQREFSKQLHDKNDKRGQWVNIAGVRTLQAKAGKDCYLVRPMATRATGLPEARTIKLNQAPKLSKSKKVDAQTFKLMQDLNVATVSYARGSMADSSLPTQKSIDEARQILQEAQKRLVKVGDDIDKQVVDNDLLQLTNVIYSRIPKKKVLHCAAKDWILNKDNILLWDQDLNCYESALATVECGEVDPMDGIPADMEWIDPTSALGKFLYKWWPNASANRHNIGNMKIKNIWKIARHGDETRFSSEQDKILKLMPQKWNNERPLFQQKERNDVLTNGGKYYSSNTALLLHGTRTQNITGILREHFRLPKQLVGVVITGAMFGANFTYMADDWRKSDGYTSRQGSYWSKGDGAIKGREAFMLACDAVLGCPYVAPGPQGFISPPSGYHSIFGKAGVSQVQNNEWLATPNQIIIRYLCEYMVVN